MELFREAADSFHAGRLAECRERLSAVHLHGFSRLQWYLECNLLACRMQALLRGGGGGRGLQGVLHSYEQLWQRMNGLPPSRVSVCVELSVVLAICQLLVLLSQWNLVKPYVTTIVERVSQVLSPAPHPPSLVSHGPPSPSLTSTVVSHGPPSPSLTSTVVFHGPPSPSLTDRLDALDISSFAEAAVRCVEKMRVLCAVVEVEGGGLEMGEREQEALRAVAAHGKWLDVNHSESRYREAWLQYCHGNYHTALQTLTPLPPPASPLSPLYHLLCGACYAKQAQPKLALLHWKKCMETGHTPGHTHFLAALQNSVVVHCRGGNTAASEALRRLEIEALKCPPSSNEPILPVWVWLKGGVTTPTGHRSLAEAIYCLAWQQILKRKYASASEALEECIVAVKNGETAPSSTLPQPSTLHLLRTLCAVCSGEGVRRGKMMCEELINSPSHPATPLWGSEVMCVLATACLHLGECAESRKWSLKCLEAVESGLGHVTDDVTLSRLQLLQQHTNQLLALGAIAHAQWREALQLLACVVATPTGLYNHCLLQCRVGVVLGGANGWVKWRRGRVPGGRSEARQWLREAHQQLPQTSEEDEERNMVAMDAAMLRLWLQHN